MTKFSHAWYVVYTMPNHEKKISEKFEEAEIQHYLPLVKRLRTWHDRKKYIYMPLFQSYIFVKLKNSLEFYKVEQIPGVLGYIRFGNQIPNVSDDTIESIRRYVTSGQDIEVTTESFPPGKRFFIQNGPLTGTECEVVQCNRINKILVRIHLLKRNLLISVPSDNLLPIPAKQYETSRL
jgi:transcriptional antiterminator RfaH